MLGSPVIERMEGQKIHVGTIIEGELVVRVAVLAD